jgi:RNA recognition motif-containing protein
MNIFVGSLPYRLKEAQLSQYFEEYGTVNSVKIITDRETGRSKGFGFVEMSEDSEGSAAIEGLNGAELDGRNIVVNEAQPRKEHTGGSGGGRSFGNERRERRY